MKKLSLVLIFVLVLTLTGCKTESSLIEKYTNNHEDTLDEFDVIETQTDVAYLIGEHETVLDSYVYKDNVANQECVATKENDPLSIEEYTAECLAFYGKFEGNYRGIIPYKNIDGDYTAHRLYNPDTIENILLTYFVDEDIIESDDDNEVIFRKWMNYNLFDESIKTVITQGFELAFPEVPVLISAVYDKEAEMFTSFIIDNTDVMKLIYSENFGMDIDLNEYYIRISQTEYTDELTYFYPSDNELVFDDYVNFFEDGDYVGYKMIYVGDEINGDLEYTDDQDVLKIFIPEGGIYNIDYNSGRYEHTILFALYGENYDFLAEYVVGETGNELKDGYLYAGTYYIVVFTHQDAIAYELKLEKIG